MTRDFAQPRTPAARMRSRHAPRSHKRQRVIANSRRTCDSVYRLMGSQMSTVPLISPRPGTLLALGLLFASGANAACPESPTDVAKGASDVIFGFEAGPKGAERLDAGRRRVESGVVCLAAAPMPYDAALMYQANALIHFMAMEDAEVSLWLRAMNETMPSLPLSAEAAPPEGPLDALYQQARAMPSSPRVSVKLPKDHTLYVDGYRTNSVPVDRPGLLVLADARGIVVWSGFVRPRDNLELIWQDHYPPPIWPLVLAAITMAGVLVGAGLVMAPSQKGGPWSQ